MTLEMMVREMTEKDLDQVVQIEKEIFSQPWSKEGFLSSLKEKSTLYLCTEIDGKIAGYCGLLQVLDEADITNVAVSFAFRRQGIARQMLQELLSRGMNRGIKNFTLEVRESNLPAQKLYEQLGFENCGIRKNFYDFPRENAVIMWKYC
ncbi:MAG: ribosomal protein S18-alanine N-acetyltransferase [Muricoprocola sp.]